MAALMTDDRDIGGPAQPLASAHRVIHGPEATVSTQPWPPHGHGCP